MKKQQDKIRINWKEYRLFSNPVMKSNIITLETDFDLQKELLGNIFDFTMLSQKKNKIYVNLIKRSKRENTTYFPIPLDFRNEDIRFGYFARCYIKNENLIFETRRIDLDNNIDDLKNKTDK